MHLKQSVVIFAAFFFIGILRGFAQSESSTENMTVHEVRSMVIRVEEEINAPLSEHFKTTQILTEIMTAPSFCNLLSITTNRWDQVLDNWNMIAVDENKRLIIEHALLFLPPEDYLGCLKRLLKLYERGQVTKGELSMMLFRPENDKRWFLSSNYRDPEVKKLFNEVSRVFVTDKHIPNLVEFYKSGKAKRRDAVLRKKTFQETNIKQLLPLLPSTIEYESPVNEPLVPLLRYSSVTVILLMAFIALLCLVRRLRGAK